MTGSEAYAAEGETRFLRISGRVQGVAFRASAARKAEKLGVRGWVRNTDDGAVEALAAGDPAALQEFISWCRRGPRSARVDALEEHAPTPEQRTEVEAAAESGFRIRR